jgi:two-component system sensor histidine kinase PhoQ
MKRISLQNRQLLAASLMLAIFLGLTGTALDKAFQSSAKLAERGKLEGEIYVLLGAAELNADGRLVMYKELAEPRFSQPGSGLVAQIIDNKNELIWQSRSALGMKLPLYKGLVVDNSIFQPLLVNNENWFSYDYGVAWVDEDDREHRYSFRVLENRALYDQELNQFRHTLISWLSAAAILLLIAQVIVLRWSLGPLRRIEAELHEVERGEREQLTEDYPRELNGLAASLNLLLSNERRHLQRYRNSLADLAHSMKTPLAVLRGVAESDQVPADTRQLIDMEVGRMDNIVEYQLQKAAAAGRLSLTEGTAILPLTNRLLESLRKVYRDRSISYQVEIDEAAIFMGEAGDLMEVIGNLLDNASKWCVSQVSINVRPVKPAATAHARHYFTIEDDGAGIAEEQAELLLQRGERGDTQVPGHGIGLAVVREIVSAYGGELTIARSEMGGAKIEVEM